MNATETLKIDANGIPVGDHPMAKYYWHGRAVGVLVAIMATEDPTRTSVWLRAAYEPARLTLLHQRAVEVLDRMADPDREKWEAQLSLVEPYWPALSESVLDGPAHTVVRFGISKATN